MPEETKKPRIALGADHAGFHTKEIIRGFLEGQGYAVNDVGTWSEESVDYPDYARKVAEAVAGGRAQLGILACGTGIGMAIAANKVPGIRAATVHDPGTAWAAREHNNANVLTLGGRVVDAAQAVEIVRGFLSASFAGGRHQRRIDKIAAMEPARASATAATSSEKAQEKK
jgi:ribose 5-phosphate isomerase B